jgi:AcrR family transcriptional regulator
MSSSDAPAASRRRSGRPRRDEGPAVTREAIIQAALRATAANGTPGLALRAIARELGVSLPAVQRHFPTKDDLWRACVDAVLAEMPEAPAPGVHRPEAMVAEHLRYQIERSALRLGLSAAMWSDQEPGAAERRAYLRERSAPVLRERRQLLEAGQARGVLRPVAPDVVLALFAFGLSSLATCRVPLREVFGIDLDDEEQRDRFTAALSDVLLHGLMAPEA